MFVENPLMTWLALEPLGNGELRLPFGDHRLAPIAGYDVAEVCAKILADPAPHISKSYELNGPELKDMYVCRAGDSRPDRPHAPLRRSQNRLTCAGSAPCRTGTGCNVRHRQVGAQPQTAIRDRPEIWR
jgi:hypothetical protein